MGGSPSSVAEFRDQARAALPRLVFDYLDGGAEDEVALRGNLASWDRVRLVPRVGRDVAGRSAEVSLWDEAWSMPFGIAPTGLANLARPGADEAIAGAALAARVPFVLSTTATTSIETIARIDPRAWFQIYMPAKRTVGLDLLRRAREAGAKVLVVTLDVPAPGKRERDLRNGFALPFRIGPRFALDCALHPAWAWRAVRAGPPRFASLEPYLPKGAGAQSLAAFMAQQITADLAWDEVARLRDAWPGRIVAKGVLDPGDVAEAARLGLDGVWLSNHGGRQLGLAVDPLSMLPAAVAAAGAMKVLVDGGVRRGSHIAAALALGASFVFAGRPTLYGVAAGGREGAKRVIEILRGEFLQTLGLLGARSPAELEPGMVRLAPS